MTGQPPDFFDQAAYGAGAGDADAEVVDGIAVIEAARPLEPPRAYGVTVPPAVVQTVAVVGASMVAGAATVALVQRRRTRKLARSRRRMLAPVLASRSFLVDVHVLGERGK